MSQQLVQTNPFILELTQTRNMVEYIFINEDMLKASLAKLDKMFAKGEISVS